jgi:hypothetical protein
MGISFLGRKVVNELSPMRTKKISLLERANPAFQALELVLQEVG